MSAIQIHGKYFVPYLSEQQIQEKVKALAATLDNDYAGKKPLFIAILNGSFMFAADIFKYLKIEAEICFIKLASYKGTKSSGQVVTAIGLDIDLTNRHVIILEDIIDTGKTVFHLTREAEKLKPASITVATLLQKHILRPNLIKGDYIGFEIPDVFVVGYGLDYNEEGRNWNGVYQLDEK